MKCRSEWQRPATLVRISTSRGPGLGRLTSSITSGLLTSCRTAAFIGVSPVVLRGSPVGEGRACSLGYLQQFANLGHADSGIAEQMIGDASLRGIFRQPERVASRDAVIDH